MFEYITGQIYDLPVELIIPNPAQPRKTFEKEPLDALKLSIEREGLLQPVAVLKSMDGKFIIAAGERRYRACCELGWKTVPARVVDGNLDDLALMENMIREDLNPMERARAMARYLDEHKMSRKKLSTVLGIARNSISEILSLNKLPLYIQDIIIADKRYSLHNMRIIARIRDSEEQRAKFDRLRSKIEKNEKTTIESQPSKKFNAHIKRERLKKIVKEVKHLQISFTKQELSQLKPQILELYEQLKGLLYKVEDDIFVRD